jgi:hypothetical protein
MDEAVQEAITGLRGEVGQVRHDISELRDDLKVHIADDNEKISALAGQVREWMGALKIIQWLCTAILGAVIVQLVKHW